ncbi:MAG: HD-GYP domain-containing protein [Candidatus Anammoxibacter sp.]
MRKVNNLESASKNILVVDDSEEEVYQLQVLSGDNGYNERIVKQLESKTVLLEKEIARRKQTEEKLRKTLNGTIQALGLVLERRDPFTAGHERRVSDLAGVIAAEMGLPENQVEGVRMAGSVHDIGKISVPIEILCNPRRLRHAEFAMIKEHCQTGYDILKGIEFPWPIAEIVLQHHEKINGSGYPRGILSGDILIEARIICVADTVEDMSSHRLYHPALGIENALDEIVKNKGILYCPDVVDSCVRLFKEKMFEFKKVD